MNLASLDFLGMLVIGALAEVMSKTLDLPGRSGSTAGDHGDSGVGDFRSTGDSVANDTKWIMPSIALVSPSLMVDRADIMLSLLGM